MTISVPSFLSTALKAGPDLPNGQFFFSFFFVVYKYYKQGLASILKIIQSK